MMLGTCQNSNTNFFFTEAVSRHGKKAWHARIWKSVCYTSFHFQHVGKDSVTQVMLYLSATSEAAELSLSFLKMFRVSFKKLLQFKLTGGESISAYYRYTGININVLWNVKNVFKAEKNAWTSDLKWCIYVVFPTDGGPITNKCLLLSALMFAIEFVKM